MSRFIDKTTDPARAYGVVLSSASHDTTENGALIAVYAPAYGAASDEAARIRQAQPGIVTHLVALRPADHPANPGQYTDGRGRTPAQIIREEHAA